MATISNEPVVVDFITFKPSFIEEQEELLLDQFHDSPNIQALLRIQLNDMKRYRDFIVELDQATSLQTAIGVQLDEIGDKVGVSRNTDDDEEYRAEIKLIIAQNSTNISRDSLVSGIAGITGDTGLKFNVGRYHYVQLYLSSVCVDKTFNFALIARLFPVTTNLEIVQSLETPFGFEGNDSANGFSDSTETDGGELVFRQFRTQRFGGI